ncbi:DUF2304 domain-containing protein [Flaviflexus massiliensis]|uniref:DUF2304 domain-containing protein n=1 Tax=Flaviflexus massiliensis TaxID=1522309 RepID=UPI0009E6A864|nr:DUF2304 domain-containing protein [Flaviflexus massiliensis]
MSNFQSFALQLSGQSSSGTFGGSLLIKLVLIVGVLIVAFLLIRSTSNTKNVAVRRLLLVLFVIIALVSILFPEITTEVAQFVGVGRGADLVLYLLVISFLSYAVVSYRRMNIFENRITDLARELAITRSRPESTQFDSPEAPQKATNEDTGEQPTDQPSA